MQKRSNGSYEGTVRYVVNDERVSQPFGYCECRYSNPPSTTQPPTSSSDREDHSSMRYKRSVNGHSKSKRQLNRNLFTPNLDDQMDIFHTSFDDSERNDDLEDLGSDEPNETPLNNRHSHNIPLDFEPVFLDQDSLPLPEENTPDVPISRQSHPHRNVHDFPPSPPSRSSHSPPSRSPPSHSPPSHSPTSHSPPSHSPPSHSPPSRSPLPPDVHRVDPKGNNLRKSKRLHYSEVEFALDPTNDRREPLPDHDHDHPGNSGASPVEQSKPHSHPKPIKRKPSPDSHHHENPRSGGSPIDKPDFHRHPNKGTEPPDSHHHHHEHRDESDPIGQWDFHLPSPIVHPNPTKDCKHVAVSKLLSQIQADYFVCCDECRRKIIKKYTKEGCVDCSKSLDPFHTPKTPCEKHETNENLYRKCGCDHNKKILENLKKISHTLCELSEARSEDINRKKIMKSNEDVKKNLLQQLNKIYDKLSSLASDELPTPSNKRNDKKCSKCTKKSRRPCNKKKAKAN